VNQTEGRSGVKAERAQACEPINMVDADFLRNVTLRKAIHAREQNRCFYCLRRTTPAVQCLDHVVPRSRFGRNSYRNLASSCMECNSQKGEKVAEDFLRELYRERRLSATELAERLRALEALASGKFRPFLPALTEN
jgi:5-methylcytosine-specific restriction endonuclease McrA